MLEYSKYNQPEELYKSQKEPNTQFKYGYNTPSYISKKGVTEKSKGYGGRTEAATRGAL